MKYIATLEIGSHSIKGAVATVAPQPNSSTPPAITLLGIETLQSDGVQYGRVQNIVDVYKQASTIIRKLENRPGISPRKISALYLNIGGRSLQSLRVASSIAFSEPKEITDDYIARLCKDARSRVPVDKEVLAMLPYRFTIDGAVQERPVGIVASKINAQFTAIVCHPDTKRNLSMVIEDRLNMAVRNLVVRPLAEADVCLTDEERQIGCVLIDMGAQTTTIAVYKDNVLQNLCTLPMGSHNITRDIAMGLNIPEKRAEVHKLEIGNAAQGAADEYAPGSNETRILNYVRARAGEILANIMHQIGAMGFTADDLPGGIIVIGRGARLRNINARLEQETKMRVRSGQCLAPIRVNDASINLADNIDIISLIYAAALQDDHSSCLDAVADDFTHAPSGDIDENRYTDIDDDNDDDNILIDDDILEQQEARDRNRRARDKKTARDEAREAEQRAKKAKKKEDEILQGQGDYTPDDVPKRNTMTTIRETIVKIFGSTDSDASLDDDE